MLGKCQIYTEVFELRGNFSATNLFKFNPFVLVHIDWVLSN